MKRSKSPMNSSQILKATRIEVYSNLTEKFGSSYGIPEKNSDENHKANFQLDRLFSIIHDN
ncbi:MAG: hypothetical protein AB8B73_05815 [Ekhidna sp.]